MLGGLEKGERGEQRREGEPSGRGFSMTGKQSLMAVAWEEGKGLDGHLLVFSCIHTFFPSGKLSYRSMTLSTCASGEGHMLLLLLLSHFSCVRLCATPETAAHQAPLSLGFSRQEHWSGLPFPSPMHESEK